MTTSLYDFFSKEENFQLFLEFASNYYRNPHGSFLEERVGLAFYFPKLDTKMGVELGNNDFFPFCYYRYTPSFCRFPVTDYLAIQPQIEISGLRSPQIGFSIQLDLDLGNWYRDYEIKGGYQTTWWGGTARDSGMVVEGRVGKRLLASDLTGRESRADQILKKTFAEALDPKKRTIPWSFWAPSSSSSFPAYFDSVESFKKYFIEYLRMKNIPMVKVNSFEKRIFSISMECSESNEKIVKEVMKLTNFVFPKNPKIPAILDRY